MSLFIQKIDNANKKDDMMIKFDWNWVMVFLFIFAIIYFIIGLLLNIPFYESRFMLGLILISFLIIIIHGWKTLGPRELLVFFIIGYIVTLIYEYTDGLGFGEWLGCRAYYSDLLGLKFFNKTPYIIPLVWSMTLYITFTMTNIIFKRLKTTSNFFEEISQRWLFKIIVMGIVSGLIMASWDLITDPVMVSMGAWNWSSGGSYYGIPLGNFEAWIEISLVVFVLYSLYLYKIRKNQIYIDGEKKSTYTIFVVVIYLSLLLIYTIFAINVNVTYAIPWAVITMVPFAFITIVRFYQTK